MGKTAVKKSATKISNIGQGTVITPSHTLVRTNVNARIASGATTDLNVQQNTGVVCEVGNVVKYLNICIQFGSRLDPTVVEDQGWLEYAIVKNREVQLLPTNANLGTKTLADVCTTSFRGDVIWTGCMPVAKDIPNAIDLKIKLPKVITKMQWGTEINLYTTFRSVDSTDTRTNSHRLVTSVLYKVYQ